MRATSTVGTPTTSAARRAATRFRTALWVGTSTLPPMWPHFFSLASWSSKWTPAAPASIIAFISSKAFSGPPKPASASATIGREPVRPAVALALGVLDLVGALEGVVDAAHHRGTLLAGYRLWSGYIWPARFASAATCQPER